MASPRPQCLALAALALASAPQCQFFADSSHKIPATGSDTENVDFADVDLDGDWDAMLADGGDHGLDQNRLYVNRGGLQGGPIGWFQDGTAAQLPVISDDSRDVEFADVDADGDPDSYTANSSYWANQPDRWWINLGGIQGGQAGHYADETSTRWVGLGGPGSSVPPYMLLAGGGYVDWCHDGDFGDLDDDGDLDLVHASYGHALTGQVPTRLFLNDGSGHFTEFNPSGFQLPATQIADSNPAIWAEGLQKAETLDTTGAFADVASNAMDIDLGDIDGDFDLDLLHGSWTSAPRVFHNRLEENGGSVLGFRDMTGAPGIGAFTSAYWTGLNNREQELEDLDRDGDLDLLGVDWIGLEDSVLDNLGTGKFALAQYLPSSASMDNGGDFLDYDGDGDLDLIIAAFTGLDRLFRNDYAGGSPGTFAFTYLAASTSGLSKRLRSLDAEAADVDADGDPDVLTAENASKHEVLYENLTRTIDVWAPYVPRVEQLPSGAAAPGQASVRAQVYDNAPHYVTWYDDVALAVTVDAFRLPDRPMASSQGQIFRGSLPANLIGSVDYAVRATDAYGNTATSATLSYTASGGPVGAAYGSSSAGSLGVPGAHVLSIPYAGSELVVAGGNALAGVPSFVGISLSKLAPPLDLGSGLIANLGFPLVTLHAQVTDAAGHHVAVYGLPQGTAGISLHVQFVTLDGTGGNLFASSQGVEIQIL